MTCHRAAGERAFDKLKAGSRNRWQVAGATFPARTFTPIVLQAASLCAM